ncbi:unnamed protein product [Ranitomeya imitator]|uniref:Leishmanolysin-like peptidase n=1 Tax=Ranitomeya imitator TaxID=111125 RepID=A0ABN9KWZ9_9NEOB|nr:unnamed protein product [Ranitomeya imitator]
MLEDTGAMLEDTGAMLEDTGAMLEDTGEMLETLGQIAGGQKRVLAGRNDGGLCWMKDEGLHLETSLSCFDTAPMLSQPYAYQSFIGEVDASEAPANTVGVCDQLPCHCERQQRPIAGYANLCPSMISTQPQEFAGMLSTVKHVGRSSNALGFSAGLFALYYDDNGEPLTPRNANGLPVFNESLGVYQWGEKVVRTVTRTWEVRGARTVQHNVQLLVTPRVTVSVRYRYEPWRRPHMEVEEVRRHFECPILEGMELENQGGIGTELNHWEKRLLEENVSPFCDTLRSNPLKLSCRQDQRAVAICNLQRFPSSLPPEYQVSAGHGVHRSGVK